MSGDWERRHASAATHYIGTVTSAPNTAGAGHGIAILTAALLFNVGQGVLRPSMPLYLERSFAANYTMVTMIPVVFGAGKWIANLPTGYLLARFGRSLMICGLLLIALIDVASIAVPRYELFLGLRGLGGLGWAMFATVATTAMVTPRSARGRAVSLLLMSETAGLLLGSATGGWLFQRLGTTVPFLFEAACMLVAAMVVALWASRATEQATPSRRSSDRHLLGSVLRTPGVLLMGFTSAVLIAIQTGIVVFLIPLYLVERGALQPESVGLVVSLGVLGRLVALWFGGNLSDRFGRISVLIPGLAGYAALLGSMVLLTHPMALGLWSFALGVAAGFVAPIATALVSDRVAPALQGVAIGWLRTMTDGGQIVGPLVLGILADAVDLSAPFLVGAVLLAGSAWQCGRRQKAMAVPGDPARES